jgi:chromate transporter
LAPIATGLLISGAFTVLLSSSGKLSVWLTVAASTAIFILKPKLNPLLVLMAAGAVQAAITTFA